MDSLKRASVALPALEGASQDSSKEACASLEDEVPAGGGGGGGGGALNVAGVEGDACSEIAVRSLFSTRLANASPRRLRLPDRLVLGKYVFS